MLIALALAAQAAPAVPPPGPPRQPLATLVIEPAAMLIATLDADNDGRTSRAELATGLARSFAAADTAHGGKLRYLDYADWALRWLGDRNALPSPFEIDTDGDDAISLTELQATFARYFDRYDKDHDGFVTRAELLTVRSGVGERPAGVRGKRGRGGEGTTGEPPR